MTSWYVRARRVRRALTREGFPFMLPAAGQELPMQWLRRLARCQLFAERSPILRLALRCAMAAAWPVGAPLETWRQMRHWPPGDRPNGRLDWVHRALDMLRLALSHNVPPREYRLYRLHDPARRAAIAEFIFWPELSALLDSLNRASGADIDAVKDKARFACLCRRHALPCIPTLAVYRGGQQVEPVSPYTPDEPALWVKDRAGSGGSGAQCWRREGDHYRDAVSGETLKAMALRETWAGRDCVVQPVIESHPDIARMSAGPLVDFRVVTGLDRDGVPVVIDSLAQIPVGCGSAVAQTFAFVPVASDGSISQPVGAANDGAKDEYGFARAVVPSWAEALELVLTAHRTVPEFARFAFLGWDVAITPSGPVLVEANHGWGCINHQSGNGRPLGETAFLRVALERLSL